MFTLPNKHKHYCDASVLLVYASLFENFQVISGKSIDDIKKEALREKQERSVEFPKAPGEKNDSLASSAILSFS